MTSVLVTTPTEADRETPLRLISRTLVALSDGKVRVGQFPCVNMVKAEKVIEDAFTCRLDAATKALTDRITQQDAVIAGLVDALELIAHEGGQAEYRIARAALAKAKESRDV